MPRALVIGGGVAGPATAMFLAADGWDVEIFERLASAIGCSPMPTRLRT
jgi:phytoene dehydrogenase-like protein